LSVFFRVSSGEQDVPSGVNLLNKFGESSLGAAINYIEIAYGAIDEPRLWQDLLDSIVERTKLQQAFLLSSSPSTAHWSVFAASGTDAATLSGFSSSQLPLDPAIFNDLYGSFPTRTWIAEAPSCFAPEPDPSSDSPSYLDQFQLQATVAVLCWNPNRCLVLLLHHANWANPPHGIESEFLLALLPHLARAISLYWNQHQIRAENALLFSSWYASPLARIVTDSASRILLTNRLSDELLSAGAQKNAALSNESGRLRAKDPEIDKKLQLAISTASSTTSQDLEPFRWDLPLSSPGGTHLLSVCSPPITVADLPTGNCACISVLDPYRQSAPGLGLLARMFSLTSAEADLCLHLAAGSSLDQAADALHVSINTVRTHLRRALNKTGSRRQSQLVALVIRVLMQESLLKPAELPVIQLRSATAGYSK
jgi:DNA-binding CsgD family transcriptional regulator